MLRVCKKFGIGAGRGICVRSAVFPDEKEIGRFSASGFVFVDIAHGVWLGFGAERDFHPSGWCGNCSLAGGEILAGGAGWGLELGSAATSGGVSGAQWGLSNLNVEWWRDDPRLRGEGFVQGVRERREVGGAFGGSERQEDEPDAGGVGARHPVRAGELGEHH